MIYEVLAVRYGYVSIPKSEVFYSFHSYGEPDALLRMDYYFWVLSSGTTTIVVDTGFNPLVGRRRGRTCSYPPLEALARLDIDPKSVSTLILTHFHYDHIGNVSAFLNADVVVDEQELAFWRSPGSTRFQFARSIEADELAHIDQIQAEGRLRLLGPKEVVMPGITALRVGGHTPGQMIVIVDTAVGPLVLASDAIHFYEELEKDRPFEVLADLDHTYQAFTTLRGLSETIGARIVAGHDPSVFESFPSLEGDCADFVVKLA